MSKEQDTNCGEQWRAVVGYEGLYEVSNHGRVRSLTRQVASRSKGIEYTYTVNGKILSPGRMKQLGHLVVVLNRSGRKKTMLVHRLVLEAFVGPCPDGMECRHFPDRSPANNRLDNLSWGTHAENERDKNSHGTNRKMIWTTEKKIERSKLYKGRKRSPESIERQRRSVIGTKRSPEACARISAGRLAGLARRKQEAI